MGSAFGWRAGDGQGRAARMCRVLEGGRGNLLSGTWVLITEDTGVSLRRGGEERRDEV